MLADVEVNAVRMTHVNRQSNCAKRRRWFGPLLIAAGNIYLKRIGAGTRVLPNDEWHLWESEVYRMVYGIKLVTDVSGWLGPLTIPADIPTRVWNPK